MRQSRPREGLKKQAVRETAVNARRGSLLTADRRALVHKKTRAAHANELVEDYVESIADLIADQGEARVVDLASVLGVTHVTVVKMIRRLREQRLVENKPYRSIFLTKSGRELATQVRKRHLLVVSFLRSLGVSESVAEQDAEGIEHHVSSETLVAFARAVAMMK